MNSPAPTARGRRTCETILAAAADLFHRQGVRAASVDEILAASGTSKGQFYHHFGSKEALVRAVLADQADRFFEQQAPLLDAMRTWDGIRAWFDAIVAAQECRGCPGCRFGMLASELGDHDPELRAGLNRVFDRWRAPLARGLAAMVEAGRLRPDADPEALSRFAVAALQGGVLLAKIAKDVGPLRVAIDEVMKHLRSHDEQADAADDRT